MSAVSAHRKAEKDRRELVAKLDHWRELLMQRNAGVSACQLHPDAIRLEINKLLDVWIDRSGFRGRDADVWDREWVPSWPLKRMSKET